MLSADYKAMAEVSILRRHGVNTFTVMAADGTQFMVPRSKLLITYPVIISISLKLKRLKLRYRIAKYNNVLGFEYDFSIKGWK